MILWFPSSMDDFKDPTNCKLAYQSISTLWPLGIRNITLLLCDHDDARHYSCPQGLGHAAVMSKTATETLLPAQTPPFAAGCTLNPCSGDRVQIRTLICLHLCDDGGLQIAYRVVLLADLLREHLDGRTLSSLRHG